MATESIITLYDSASRSGKALHWNTLVLKTRYALALKNLPYKTIYLEYPNIEATMRSIGAKPTSTKPDGSPLYTMPVIIDPQHKTPSGEPTVISETWAISEYLDTTYPDRPLLFPPGTKALQRLLHDHFWGKLFRPIAPILVPTLMEFLNDESRPYWRQTREAYLGEKLEDMCPKGTAKCEERWGTVQRGFSELAKLLVENRGEGGIFVMGNQVSYADLMVLAVLESVFIIMPDDWEGRVKDWDDGRWERLRNKCTELGIRTEN